MPCGLAKSTEEIEPIKFNYSDSPDAKSGFFFFLHLPPMSATNITATFYNEGKFAMPKQRQFMMAFLKILSESQQLSLALKRLPQLEVGTPEHSALTEKIEALDWKVNGKRDEAGERIPETANYKYFFLGGAIRGTKTVTTMAAGLAICKFFPGCRGHIIRKSNKNLVLAIQSMEKLLKGSTGLYWKRGQQEYYVQLKNGSRIYFTTEAFDTDKQLTKFLGMEMNWVLFEQLEEMREETFTRVMGRLGSYYGLKGPIPPIILLATFNPTYGWLKKKIYDPWKKGELKAPYYYLELLPQDNPYVTEDQWQSWKNLPEDEYQRMIEGQWDIKIKNQFCYAFDPKRNIAKEKMEIDYRYDIWLSFDFNVDPMTAILGQTDECTSLKILHEFRIPDSDTYSMCEAIRPFIAGMEHIVKVTGDASGKNRMAGTRGHINHYEIIKEQFGLTNAQFKLPGSNPFISDSRVFVNALLQRLPECLINESCEHLLNDIRFVQVDMDREGNIAIKKTGSNEALGVDNSKIGHLLDTFRYISHATFTNWLKVHHS